MTFIGRNMLYVIDNKIMSNNSAVIDGISPFIITADKQDVMTGSALNWVRTDSNANTIMNLMVSQEQATWTTHQVSELWEGPEDREVNWRCYIVWETITYNIFSSFHIRHGSIDTLKLFQVREGLRPVSLKRRSLLSANVTFKWSYVADKEKSHKASS